jgi:hypothetical protein
MTPEQEKQQAITDWKMTFGSEHGARTLKRLSILCKENRPTYVDQNALGTAYNEGFRGVILHIRSQLNKDPMKDSPTQVINERTL